MKGKPFDALREYIEARRKEIGITQRMAPNMIDTDHDAFERIQGGLTELDILEKWVNG
jgi:hypothetical protein